MAPHSTFSVIQFVVCYSLKAFTSTQLFNVFKWFSWCTIASWLPKPAATYVYRFYNTVQLNSNLRLILDYLRLFTGFI